MTLQSEELPGQLLLAALEGFAHRDGGVVTTDSVRDAAEELERPTMPLQERLSAFPGESLQEDRPRVGERHHEEGQLPLLAGEPDRRLTEVDPILTRRMGERHEDLLMRLLPFPDCGLHGGQLPLVAMLIPQTLEHPPSGMPLLARRRAVRLQDLLNDREERLQLGTGPALLISRRLGVSRDLLEGLQAELELAAGDALSEFAGQDLLPDLFPELQYRIALLGTSRMTDRTEANASVLLRS